MWMWSHSQYYHLQDVDPSCRHSAVGIDIYLSDTQEHVSNAAT